MKKVYKYLFRMIIVLLVLVGIGLIIIKVGYGIGEPYPDMSPENAKGFKEPEKLIKLDFPPGNIAVGQNGHVYFNYHPLARPNRLTDATVFEWADGKITPFPSLEMQKEFQGTFGMTIDKQNRIWFIEPASLDFEYTRIWAFDLTTRQKVHFYEFPKGVAPYSQDLRVTADGKYVLLPNPGVFRFTDSKLFVYSVEDHSIRLVLEGGQINPEKWLLKTNDGRPYRLLFGLVNFCGGLDGIEISEDQQWVYLAPMTHSSLFRVPLASVLDKNMKPEDVAQKIEKIGKKTLSDGITVDKTGNVIITDIEHGGLVSFDVESKKTSVLVRSKNIIWADGVVAGPDSSLYFTDSAIPEYVGEFAGAPDKTTILKNKPYYIYQFKY